MKTRRLLQDRSENNLQFIGPLTLQNVFFGKGTEKGMCPLKECTLTVNFQFFNIKAPRTIARYHVFVKIIKKHLYNKVLFSDTKLILRIIKRKTFARRVHRIFAFQFLILVVVSLERADYICNLEVKDRLSGDVADWALLSVK